MTGRMRNPESNAEDHPFDICGRETVEPVTLEKSLLELNREKIKEIECSKNPPQHAYLRSGMILLKNYVSHHDQNGDESKKSLQKGLPVISFSLGDSAEFLYGVERDADNAEKVVLESGDILMFGGNSRLIYHGVSCIHPNTAPKRLIEETKLRPGRLNLTFRQY